MLTRLAVRNFKLFDDIELDLGQQVVLIGPNNAGKTTALRALALTAATGPSCAKVRPVVTVVAVIL